MQEAKSLFQNSLLKTKMKESIKVLEIDYPGMACRVYDIRV